MYAAGVVNPCTETSLNTALSGGGLVTFACSGTISLTSTKTITSDTTIDGAGQSVTLDGQNSTRHFVVTGGATLNLRNLTVANGNAATAGGGAIQNIGGTVNIRYCTFSGNSASGSNDGGAIHNLNVVDIKDSTFDSNSAGDDGGAILTGDGDTLSITRSIFSNNGAVDEGGAIYVDGSTVSISDSEFSTNNADDKGGAMRTTVRAQPVSRGPSLMEIPPVSTVVHGMIQTHPIRAMLPTAHLAETRLPILVPRRSLPEGEQSGLVGH